MPTRQQLYAYVHPFATRQFQDLGLGELGHDAEVVGIEVLQHREVGVLDPLGDRVGGAGRQFQFGQSEQELSKRLVGRGGVPRQLLELLAHRRQAELSKMALEQVNRHIRHCSIPFVTTVLIRGPHSTIEHGRFTIRLSQAKNTLTGLSKADSSLERVGLIELVTSSESVARRS